MNYNISVLRSAVTEYCDAESNYRMHTVRMNRAKRDLSYYDNRQAWNNDNMTMYRASWSCYDKLFDMCKLVGADVSAVLAVEKSIRRNMQYQRRWESEPGFSRDWWTTLYEGACSDHEPGSEYSYRKTVETKDSDGDYWKSTGRRKAWTKTA